MGQSALGDATYRWLAPDLRPGTGRDLSRAPLMLAVRSEGLLAFATTPG
jgi:hypothetical protein